MRLTRAYLRLKISFAMFINWKGASSGTRERTVLTPLNLLSAWVDFLSKL